MGKRSMKVLCLELCNYVQLNEVLTPMSSSVSYLHTVLFTREHTDPLQQYRVGCVVYNVHEQVMPEN